MKTEDKELLLVLQKFQKLIESTEDDMQTFPEYRSFLRLLLRTKHSRFSLPVIEIASIIKRDKPNIYFYLRKQANQDFMLSVLTGNLMSPDKAEQRLDEFIEKLKSSR